jgi:hypothetical protein
MSTEFDNGLDANPFTTAEAWEASTDTILSAGDHVVKVMEIDGSGNSSGGHPQIELRMSNDLGSLRDWIVVIPSTVGKVTQLFEALGLDRPTDDQVVQDATGWRFDPKYLDQAHGRQVGVIVREEPDRQDPTRMRTRVKGYVKPDTIGSDVTSPTAAQAFSQPKDDDSFPFLWRPVEFDDVKTHATRPF